VSGFGIEAEEELPEERIDSHFQSLGAGRFYPLHPLARAVRGVCYSVSSQTAGRT
jgi:hypothetical protein